MPGAHRLAKELGVNHKTIKSALGLLEHAGLLKGQGPGRQREIVMTSVNATQPGLRVAILLHEKISDHNLHHIVELHHTLEEAGHSVVSPAKTLTELKMDVKRISQLVEHTAADAWIICAGSPQVLAWFSARPEPAFARFGRPAGLPMAGVGFDKQSAFSAATRRLIDLGHRRIVLLVRKTQRRPKPGPSVRAFLDELEAHDIPTSNYNLPDWEESREGFHDRLASLFQITPPTALIIDEEILFSATQQFLLQRGIRVPADLSLICSYSDPSLAWCEPSVAHIHMDTRPIARHVARWVASVHKGQRNTRQTFLPADFIPGGTIGPAPST